MNQRIVLLIFLWSIIVIVFGGCGFHLGDNTINVPKELQTIYLQTNNPYSHFTKQLKRICQRYGISIVDDINQAPLILDILSHQETILPLGNANTTSSNIYQLSYHVKFAIKTLSEQNKTETTNVIGPKTLSASNTLTLPNNTLPNNDSQTKIIFQTLQVNVIKMLLNDLSSVDTRQKLTQSWHTSPMMKSSPLKSKP